MRDYVIEIVQRYLGRGKQSGQSNLSFKCPFHKNGQETRPSFSINVDKGLFNCFTCHVAGTIPHLLILLGVSRETVDAETAVIKLALQESRKSSAFEKSAEWKRVNPFEANPILPESMIKMYEYMPTSLVDIGFRSDVLHYMEIGVDVKNNRITYPVRDIYGNLAGFMGGHSFVGQYPKYKVYEGKRTSSMGEVQSDYGEWFDELFPGYNFKVHDFLWNFDKVYPRIFFERRSSLPLIIVEGFKACMWLVQNGWINTIALMQSSLSEKQEQLLSRLRTKVVIFLDNNEAGKIGTTGYLRNDGSEKSGIAQRLNKIMEEVIIARYPENADESCQPDDLSADELNVAITNGFTYFDYIVKGNKK